MGRSPSDTSIDDLLRDLTGPQAEAVRHTDGPLLVLAGAGAGKTRVITRRAAYLAQTVTAAHKVLAITFTNKAANEMRERVHALGVTGGMTLCTFHSLAARLLRMYHDRVGLPADFTIFDTADQRRVLKQAIEDAGLSTDHWTPGRIHSVIGNAKNAMVTAEMFARDTADFGMRHIARIYEAYEKLMTAQHGLDFDDLLLKLAFALRDDATLRSDLERRYSHVLIDEYQDTNTAQYDIARLIALENRNICATGDPDQSIYGWRGADIRNILRFEEDYPEARVVRLEQNYRSTKRILAAASAVIEHNEKRKEKSLWTENPEGEAVRVVTTPDSVAEAELIAKELAGRRDKGESLSGVAVFYRVNSLSRTVEEALLKGGVPYQVARGVEFYARKEIKDVLAYTRVLVNPFDEVSLLRIINTPTRGIGKTTLERLVGCARSAAMPLMQVVREADRVESLGKAARSSLRAFVALLDSLAPAIEDRPATALNRILLESGLQAEASRVATYDRDPMDNINELISAAAHFEKTAPEASLREWLEYTSLLSDVDSVDEESGSVTLMTLHAAKGLEFPTVYIIGLEDGMLPFRRLLDEDDMASVEEERRLFFVGMTRSKRELTLMHTDYRMVRGVSERKAPSEFLSELPSGEIEYESYTEKEAGGGARGYTYHSLPADIELWQAGTLVRHPEYDLGQILWIRRNGQNYTVAVRFRSGPEKTFNVRYAELERVDFDEVG